MKALRKVNITYEGDPPTLRQIEYAYVVELLRKHGGNKTLVARDMGVSLKTVYNRLTEIQEDVPDVDYESPPMV